MKKRLVLMLAAIAIFMATIGAVKYGQIKKGMAQQAAFQMPPETVTTMVAKSDQWPATLSAIGTVNAVHGVTVSADLPGIVSKISFESGKFVREGEVLVRLDTKQEEAQLAAGKAQWELGRLNLDRMRELSEQGVAPKADFDRLDAEFKQAEARVGEINATIARKTIRAPFSGMLGIRQVNLGQYLEGGGADRVAPVDGPDLRELLGAAAGDGPAAARQRNQGQDRRRGRARRQAHRDELDHRRGHAKRPDPGDVRQPRGEAASRNVRRNEVDLGAGCGVVALPASAINHAPYGDSVFVVEDMKGPKGKTYRGVRQQFVKLGGAPRRPGRRRSGVKAGDEVVTSGVFKLRNGAAVQVDNKIQPGNNPAPQARGQLNETDGSLHPPAGAGDRRQPGHPDRRAAGDPLAQRAAVPAERHRGRSR